MVVSVIIPASNEERFIGPCLDALLGSTDARGIAVIVAANGCSDGTARVARSRQVAAAARGWCLTVLTDRTGNKARALNAADAIAPPGPRIYLDADVRVAPDLLDKLARVLVQDAPLFVTGKLCLAPARSHATLAYGRIWTRLPFVTDGASGAGVYAVTASGRTRWGAFPDIISDDSFARMSFAPAERVEVDAAYSWPLPEGFRNLVRVRRRADAGLAELASLFPDLSANEGKTPLGPGDVARLALGGPLGFAVYAAVILASRATPWRRRGWTRGR